MDVKEDITLFDTVFSDYDTVSDWAKESCGKMDSLGIMRGVGDNNFSPKSNYHNGTVSGNNAKAV